MRYARKYWWILPILLILLVVFLGDSILTKITRSALDSTLQKAFAEKSFQSEFDDVEVSFLGGSFQLKDLRIYRETGSAPERGLLQLRVSDVELKGFSAWNILVNKRLKLTDIHISDIDLLLGTSKSDKGRDSLESLVPTSIEFMGLKAINLKEVVAERIQLRRIKDTGDTSLVYQGKAVSLTGLQFNSNGKSKKLRPEFDGMRIRLMDQKFGISDGEYLVQYDSLELSTETNQLRIHGLSIAPEIDKFELADSYSSRRDVYDFKVREIELHNFKFRQLLEKADLQTDSIFFRQPELAIYISTRLQRDTTEDAVFPQQGVKSSPLSLDIRSIGLHEGSVIYKELHGPSKSNFNLQISFNSLRAGPLYSNAIQRGVEAITLNTSGIFLENIPYEIALKFPYETEDTYSFAGSIGSFQMSQLNSLLVPLEAVEIKSGICNGVTFNSICSVSGCSGEFAMRYKDLEIDMLKENRVEKKGLKSFFANIVIRQNNPVGSNLKTVPMQIERQPHHNFINLLDNSLVTGMKQTIKPF